jgi:anti-sigma B factor antagonist
MNIRLEVQGDTLSIGGIRELSAANATLFRDQVRSAMAGQLKNIEIDLSQALFLDSCGLGALISLHKTACSRQGLVRLINPASPVQQILELTRMHRIFEVVRA